MPTKKHKKPRNHMITRAKNALKAKGKRVYQFGGTSLRGRSVDGFNKLFTCFPEGQRNEFHRIIMEYIGRNPVDWTMCAIICFDNGDIEIEEFQGKVTTSSMDEQIGELRQDDYKKHMKIWEESLVDNHTKVRKPISSAWYAVPSIKFDADYHYPKIKQLLLEFKFMDVNYNRELDALRKNDSNPELDRLLGE